MTTVQFEYDPERLIEEIKKRPGLWDFDHIDYKSKIVRYKLWSEVVQELMGKDVNITKSEVRELELQLQKKWKSMRDCFQKYISNPNRSRRPYVYTKQLTFLLKNSPKPIPKREGSNDSDDGRKRMWKTKRKFELTKESSEEDNVSLADDSRNESEIVLDVSSKLGNTSTAPPDEFVFANVDSYGYDDPDKMFLVSLLPHLKAVPEEYRLSVKMELMQVLRNYNAPDQKNIL